MARREELDHEPTIVSEKQKGVIRRAILSGPEAAVEGWAFGLAMPAFAAALDILHSPYLFIQTLSDGSRRTVERMLWTRGTELAFDIGDTFHAPPLSPGPWADQMKLLTHSIQVKDRQSEILAISIRWWNFDSYEMRILTQKELAELLINGLQEGGIQ